MKNKTFPTNNHDESLATAKIPYIGNFHKTLPHNQYGEVEPSAYRQFKGTCLSIEAGAPINFENVPAGDLFPAFDGDADCKLTTSVAKFTSPLAGAATEELGIDPKDVEMPAAPPILSASTAAEMTELYWMALLRDVPLLAFEEAPKSPKATDACFKVEAADRNLVDEALSELKSTFADALRLDAKREGGLRLGLDLPKEAVQKSGCSCGERLDIDRSTLFRSGLQDEEFGPIVSQFFIRDIPYGVQTIDQKQTPYIMGKDFLTNHDDWLRAQNTGKDKFGRDYGNCNNYEDQVKRSALYYPDTKRYISTMRDLARFVNRDALHQAYFNAALFLDSISAPLDAGNPYGGNLYAREGGFATLGGPDLLTLVSEVASRSLKVVWRQKWLVHRRCRPEVYGGLMQMQFNGYDCGEDKPMCREYGLPAWVATTKAANRIMAHNNAQNGGNGATLFLPMAFSAGSPSHPAYGAGHATVAGACVTVLKAWFDEDAKLGEVIKRAQLDDTMGNNRKKDPGVLQGLLQPGARINGEDFCEPQPYCGDDANKITVGGELNKIASNVAMGRTMGGVHWRSDNTRSLRLGEKIAIEILRKRTMEYAEMPVSFTLRTFDREMIRITQGQVMKL
jgi:hypothetical protein